MNPEPVPSESGSTPQPEPAPAQPSPAPAEAPAPVRVVAIGTAGLATLRELLAQGMPASLCAAVHSDAAALGACQAGDRLHVDLDSSRIRALTTGTDPEQVAAESLPRMKSLCANARVVLVAAGLGGGAGTCLAPTLARAARDAGAFVVAFAVLPFDCEGNLRAQVALQGLSRLRESAHLVILMPNQRTISLIDDATTLTDTFKASNQLLAASVASVWRACSGENVMGLPFADLGELIRRRAPESHFAVAEAAGPNRVADVLERLLKHPLVPNPLTMAQAPAVGVVILGGPTLAMVEINRIMERLQRECGGAPLVMSTFILPEPDDALRVALLVPSEIGEPADTPAAAAMLADGSRAHGSPEDLEARLVDRTPASRPASRFVAPPPTTTSDRIDQLKKPRRSGPRLRQGQLPLEIVSKGRFEKSEPTIHGGEDLDIPTYIRRHISLN